MNDDQFRELASGQMAEQAGAELARELSHPEPLPPLSIYRIKAELQELLEERENAEAEGAPPDELAVIDERVKQYALAEVKKVDSTAVALRGYKSFAEECFKERDRFDRMGKRHLSRYERIKGAVMWAMGHLGVTKLSTPQNTLRVQGNGGLEPLEVYDVSQIPDSMKRVSVTMTMGLWKCVQVAIAKGWISIEGEALPHADVSVIQEAIRAELKKRVPCPECKGSGEYQYGPDTREPNSCPRCGGTGTVLASVPGARLLPRGTQLRVE